ncbi:MAG: type II secretion system protein GspM [Thermodesulfobacteriota bacterium]
MKTWETLSKRERYAICLAFFFIVSFFIVRLLIYPILDKRSRAASIIQTKKKILSEMTLLQSEHQTLQVKIQSAEKILSERSKTFTLFSFVEGVASGIGIKDRISYLKPSGSIKAEGPYRLASIELKLESISTESLVSFLYQVETSTALTRVRRLSISKTGEPKGLIDAVFQIETLET